MFKGKSLDHIKYKMGLKGYAMDFRKLKSIGVCTCTTEWNEWMNVWVYVC